MMLETNERLPIYRLLATLLVREVDASMWNTLQEEELIRFFEASQPDFRNWILADVSEDRIEKLSEEFARLFLVPKGVPPFASAWLEGDREKLGAEWSAFVLKTLGAMGREATVSAPWGRLPLDHLALLLDLVVAAATRSPSRHGDLALARHLESQLLGPWVVRFGRALEVRASSPLYRSLGAILVALHEGEGED